MVILAVSRWGHSQFPIILEEMKTININETRKTIFLRKFHLYENLTFFLFRKDISVHIFESEQSLELFKSKMNKNLDFT